MFISVFLYQNVVSKSNSSFDACLMLEVKPILSTSKVRFRRMIKFKGSVRLSGELDLDFSAILHYNTLC